MAALALECLTSLAMPFVCHLHSEQSFACIYVSVAERIVNYAGLGASVKTVATLLPMLRLVYTSCMRLKVGPVQRVFGTSFKDNLPSLHTKYG